jgi:hypothetical protein
MKGSDFENHLKESANKATLELREVVKREHEKHPEDQNIYPYEATFTALVFHHLLNRCLKVGNLHVESSYDDGRRRMDLYYTDGQSKEEYCIEVKTVLSLTKKGRLYKRRDGLVGIGEDISRLTELKKQKKRIMIVAYLGFDHIDDKTFREWENQIREKDGIVLMFF